MVNSSSWRQFLIRLFHSVGRNRFPRLFLSTNMSNPNLRLTDLVRRPGVGVSGKKIKVRANFYEVTHLPQMTVIHYDVTIDPEMPPTMNRKVWQYFEENFINNATALGGIYPVYDGKKSMFSPKKLPFGNAAVYDIIFPEEHGLPHPKFPRKFKIKIKYAADVNMAELQNFLDARIGITNNCLTAIMVLDILIRHKPSMMHATVGRSFFTNRNARVLPDGLEAWGGWYQSVRPTPGRMMINVDVSTTAFHQSGPLLAVIARMFRTNPNQLLSGITDRQRAKLDKILKSVRIKVTHRGENSRKYKIFRFTREGADRTTFHNDTSNQTETVAAYFQSQYNRRLSHPKMPCVVVQKNMYLPVEVCEIIPGQRYMRKLSREQTTEMIKFAASPPSVRANRIQDGVNELAWRNNTYLQGYELQATTQPMTLDARMLNAPRVHYASNSKNPNIIPRNGAWNLMGVKVATGASLGSWAVAVFNERSVPPRQIEAFIREMVLVFQDTGMNVVNRDPVIRYYNPQKGADAALKDAYLAAGNSAKAKPQILFCVLPDTGVDLYADIKRVSDTVIGIPTQCMQVAHTERPKKQYCANVCLKVNLKLGGMNSFLDPQDVPFIAQKPTIVFGADITHPGPGDERKPSIAALCASLDAKASRYCATIRLQKARVEIINDLESMVELLMKNFYQGSGNKPARILFYRDGVSESEFKQVVDTEIKAIKAACRNLDEKYNPPITFIVVQKRHHARFFGIDNRDMDPKGNLNPGLVVDQTVTHPCEFDFYMQAHAGLQGTCRPTHYQVLFDENRFTSDALQELTYKLCYIYGRATRSVSVVPAAYYADLVATRARFHFHGENFSDTDPTTTTTTSDAEAKPLNFGTLHRSLWGSMYFI